MERIAISWITISLNDRIVGVTAKGTCLSLHGTRIRLDCM
jgi:hypothetical protein